MHRHLPHPIPRALVVLASVGTLAACGDLLGPDYDAEVEELAWLEYEDDGVSPRAEVPTTVTAGASFEIRFFTSSGGCERPGGTEVHVSRHGAEVVPHMFRRTEFRHNENCPDFQLITERTVRLTLPDPGDAQVVLVGRRSVPGAPGTDTLQVAESFAVEVVAAR